jgi:hypothetical protein
MLWDPLNEWNIIIMRFFVCIYRFCEPWTCSIITELPGHYIEIHVVFSSKVYWYIVVEFDPGFCPH